MNDGTSAEPAPSGVLVIAKPKGPTSHDVVAGLRRSLRTRRIGHAGTLDPAASGVLVVLVGEATKLAPYLTAHDKEYRATIAFGRATTTLDAEGATTSEAPVPPWLALELAEAARGITKGSRLADALARERERTQQLPPAFSAIKLGGQTAYARARRGETVELSPRDVRVASLEVLGAGAGPAELTIALGVSKGYYVRSFAHDVGQSLQVPSHLAMLERTASGPFRLAEAIAPSQPREALVAALVSPYLAIRRAMPCVELTEEAVLLARQGKRLTREHFAADPGTEPCAWLRPPDQLVAIGESDGSGGFVVRRGFTHFTSSEAT